jgi:hypothetical protein
MWHAVDPPPLVSRIIWMYLFYWSRKKNNIKPEIKRNLPVCRNEEKSNMFLWSTERRFKCQQKWQDFLSFNATIELFYHQHWASLSTQIFTFWKGVMHEIFTLYLLNHRLNRNSRLFLRLPIQYFSTVKVYLKRNLDFGLVQKFKN